MTDKRTDILDAILDKAQFFINNTKVLEFSVVEALKYLAKYLQTPESPEAVMSIFKQVTELHNQGLSIIQEIVTKFPVEHSIQELVLLQQFRQCTEYNKQTILTNVELLLKEQYDK